MTNIDSIKKYEVEIKKEANNDFCLLSNLICSLKGHEVIKL